MADMNGVRVRYRAAVLGLNLQRPRVILLLLDQRLERATSRADVAELLPVGITLEDDELDFGVLLLRALQSLGERVGELRARRARVAVSEDTKGAL